MKKLINIAFGYALAGLAAGVFYREFTKVVGFTGETALKALHPHLLMLGMGIFLILALFSLHTDVMNHKRFSLFLALYNAGLIWTVTLLAVRGVLQVMGTVLSKGADAAISGAAGLGHILLSAGIVFLFICLRGAKANAVT